MKKINNYLHFFLFSVFLLIGIITYKSYGIGIEENFQRSSGFYWLQYILSFTEFNELKEIIKLKIEEINRFNPQLPKVESNLSYGVIFDLPIALLEILINFDENKNDIFLKHFFSFFIFFLSSFCFLRLLDKRFSNFYISTFGVLIYFFSPRIFGSSFFDGKDLFFLSIMTITFYFYFKFEEKKTLINLVLFSLFAAFSTSSRVIGGILPISFVLIYFFNILTDKNNYKIYLKTIFYFLLIFFSILYIHWPYLWNFELNNVFTYMNITVFFDNDFYKQQFLPLIYIPKWIFISNPIFVILLFLFGLFSFSKRFFKRLLNAHDFKYTINNSDFWRSKNEKFDFLIFISFFQIIFIYMTFDLHIYGAWRHFLFIHFFISYISVYLIYLIYLSYKKRKLILRLLSIVLTLFILEMLYKVYLYHPYQSIYFNNIISKKEKYFFERDAQSLSRVEAIQLILDESKDKKQIKIGTASWTPLGDVLYMFNEEEIEKIKFIGNEVLDESDYIFTNYIYNIDIRYNKKYDIPDNFYLFKSVFKDDTLIYSIFKKK